jgi:hypothetical protein
MKKINNLLKEYNDLIELKHKKHFELFNTSDGYNYITNLRSYGSNTYEKHTNYATVLLLCDEYYGDNGIVDVYTNNPLYKKENYKSWNEEKDEYYPNIIHTYGDIKYLSDEQMNDLNTRDVSMGMAIGNIMADMLDINKK